ncbi:MAG: hypothetical protein HOH37_06380 [Gammaproteobacteria bacterium]|nr:hypothetical protein [Gammaproteobacteria bacterium]
MTRSLLHANPIPNHDYDLHTMSDEQNDIKASADAEFDMEDSMPKKQASSSKGARWLALLAAIIALVVVAYMIFDTSKIIDNSNDLDNLTSIENLNRRVDQSGNAPESRVNQITHPDYSAKIDAVQKNVEDQLRLLNTLPSRMSMIEDRVASLVGISAGARAAFLLSEAEYYLQIANAQLQLANNPRLASLALRMADERVTQISDPGLTAVRGAISDELTALEVMEKPDLEGATLTLAGLAEVVESLPLASVNRADEADEEIDPKQGNIDRAWGSVKSAMSDLVKVTPPDAAKLMLISPDAEYFLRNNIALQLQSARLALLRGEQAIFEQNLNDTSALLDAFFDTDNEQVSSAKVTISEVRAAVFTASVPDISGSLSLLRQLPSLRETTE